MLTVDEKAAIIIRQMELFTAAALPAMIDKYGTNTPLVAAQSVRLARETVDILIPVIETILEIAKQ